MSDNTSVIVTQLVVDSSGAKTGVDAFEAALDRARDSTAHAGESVSSFNSTLKRWTQSLASTDPVLRAQVTQQQALNRQLLLNQEAVRLGITTQEAASAQLDRINQKYGALVTAAERAALSHSMLYSGLDRLKQGFEVVTGAAGTLGLVLGAGAVVGYGKHVFDTTADLKAQAEQVLGAGGNVEAFQALRAVFAANGISTQDGDQLLGHLTRTLGEAAQGSKQAQDAFGALHLQSRQLAGLSADAALPLVVAQLLKVKDASTRAAEETAIFGRSGQQLESALTALNRPLQNLIDQGKAAGQVIDLELIEKADIAKNQITQSFDRIAVAVAPIVVQWAEGFSDFAKGVGDSSDAISDLTKNIGIMAAAWGGAKLGSVFGPWGAVIGAVGGGGVAYATTHPKQVGDFIGNLGLSAEGYDIQSNYNQGLVLESARNGGPLVGGVESVTVTGMRNNAPGWKPTQEDVNNAYRLRETFDGYVQSLQEAARLAGETTAQQQNEQAVLKAAQIAQIEAAKNHKLLAEDVIRTYALGADYLGRQKVAQIELEESMKRVNGILQQGAVQQALVAAGSQVDADHRGLVLKNLQDEIAAGGVINQNGQMEIRLTDQARAAIEGKNKTVQDGQDATAWRDYLDRLKEESSLAGLSADERERQAAVLQAMHMMHGRLSADQKSEIDGIIATRQETERLRSIVDGMATPCEEYPSGFVESIQMTKEISDKLKEIFA